MTLTPGPDSELLRSFVAVATHRNVTRAAKTINRTQSSVSIHIKRLESELSQNLFDRLPRGMALTEEGRSLLPVAQRALAEVDSIVDLFKDPLTGTLRLGIPDDYSRIVLQRALFSFSRQNGGVQVQVTCGCTESYPELIETNQLDLAVHSARPSDTDPILFSEPMVWAAHRDFDLKVDEPIPLAVLDRTCWWKNVPTNALVEAGLDWTVMFSSESHDGVRAAIQSRMAVGVLPESGLPEDVLAIDRLPNLPASDLSILSAKNGPDQLVDTMTEALRAAFRSLHN